MIFNLCLKNKMQRILIVIGLMLCIVVGKAQQINLDKAEQAIEEGFYERAYKLTNEAIENEVTKKNPLTYYLRGQCLYILSKEDFFIKKNPEAIKDACKMVMKGKEKDKDGRLTERFRPFVAELVATNDSLAFEEYKVNRYPKAIKLYNISYNLNGDTTAYYMIGKSYQMSLDTANAKFYYKNLINWYNELNKSGDNPGNAYIDPFLFLADVYWHKKNYDSANYYLDIARNIFGNKNSKINFYQYHITRDQIATQPPSSLMLEVIRKALAYSPSDTFLIKKENAVVLYLIRNGIDAGNFVVVDTLIDQFARAKALKGSDPAFESLKTTDIFLQPYADNVMWKMSDYYFVNTHDKAASYLAKRYILKTSLSDPIAVPTEKDIIARWIKIINFAKDNEDPGYVTLLMTQAVTDYPKSKELAELKKKLSIK
jgi:tetratricopeptide (TPR) repeat protein